MRSLTIFIFFAAIALSIASKLKYGQNINAMLTCKNERLVGSTLSAKCKRMNDSMQNTSVDLNICLGNIDGTLTKNRDFLLSCKNCRLSDETLFCDCKRRDGSWNSSSIEINSFVGNDNGILRC
jgi:hypothetical protein